MFLIVFLWQVPHFLAIAWIYREQYARAGLRMQPCYDSTGRGTGWRMVGYCLVLLPVSLAPLLFGGGMVYGVSAGLLGSRFPGLGNRLPADAVHAALHGGCCESLYFICLPCSPYCCWTRR